MKLFYNVVLGASLATSLVACKGTDIPVETSSTVITRPAPVPSTTSTTLYIAEDDPRWDAETMGNHRAGPDWNCETMGDKVCQPVIRREGNLMIYR